MTKHSKIGASSCERWWNCPGSIEFCKDIPQETSVYAAEGTQAHSLAEYCLKNYIPPSKLINQTVKLDGKKVLIEKEMAGAVQVYFSEVMEDLEEFYPNGIPLDHPEFALEQKFFLPEVDKNAFGRNDASLAEPFNVLRVYDYKHGKGVPVNVTGNKQLMYYALGVLHELGEAEDLYPEIELVIVQPRAPHPDGPVRRQRLSHATLMEFKAGLIEAVKATKEKDAKLCAGAWCRFCPGRKNGCPAISQQAVEVAQEQFQPSAEGMGFSMRSPSDMSLSEIQKVLDAGSIINDWVAGVQKFAHARAEKGERVPGYKLVKKKSNRKWGNEEEMAEAFVGTFGTDIYNMKLKSPAQMEKVIPKKELEKYITKPDTGTSLVPESDNRKEVAGAIESQFDVIKEK